MFNYLNWQAVFGVVYIYCYQSTTVVIWMVGTCIYSATLETSTSIFSLFFGTTGELQIPEYMRYYSV